MTKANKKCFSLDGKEMTVDRRIRKDQKKTRMVKKLMCWLLCIWDKDMWKAHQVNVIRHQQILRVKEDGHKSIFLQFYRSYLNISIAQFTPGSAFHKGKPVLLGWKKYCDENVKTYSYRQLLSFWSPTRWHFIYNSLEKTNLKFDFKKKFYILFCGYKWEHCPKQIASNSSGSLIVPSNNVVNWTIFNFLPIIHVI